ncbi:50S ribosomal protein L19 [Candidatus Annandia adelgestsuga]|uniref:50S ribosomal protein L19 n=1 Tax=Candidatus Annandia adelgestsuga TaxID=1302411 RepID=A0A3S5HNV6_9ENTR|nr:50S ribosomal protein L19 [Candidatus Annandia adelgestsuga]AZP36152.1 50S ribosomal protein L19 [Candidatus Annandia adelgestsuga]
MKKKFILKFEKSKINKKIPYFRSGDIVEVQIKIKENENIRLQSFEGIVISKRKNGINSNFTVRKISYNEGIERVFPIYSPIIHKIIVKKHNLFKKSKLYYIRKSFGKNLNLKKKNIY